MPAHILGLPVEESLVALAGSAALATAWMVAARARLARWTKHRRD